MEPQPISSPAFSCEIHLVSVCGPVRDENQDAGVAWRGRRDEAVLIVADGMGGHAAGREAAQLVVKACLGSVRSCADEGWPAVLRDAIGAAHAAVLSAAANGPGRSRSARSSQPGMGATVAIAVLSECGERPRLHVAHVGDSRVYLYRGRSLYRLTTDHSLVAGLVRDGLLAEEDAFGHPDSNVVQRAIGQAGPLEAEVQEPIDLDAGDTVLICSDGLHGSLRDQELGSVLGQAKSAGEICQGLLDAALAADSQDNITIGCARVAAAKPQRRPTRVQ